jgi:hypothetical protein
MARRALKPRKTAVAAAAAASPSEPDFDSLLRSLMQSASTGAPSRWNRVFQHLNDTRQHTFNQPLANPLLIPLA